MGYIEPTALRSHEDTNAQPKLLYTDQPESERRLTTLASTVFSALADTEGRLEGLFQGVAKKMISGRETTSATGSVTVTFANPLPHANYSVLLTGEFLDLPGTKAYYTGKTVAGFTIECEDSIKVNWIVLY